jgi:cellobiose PTS system EIIC component
LDYFFNAELVSLLKFYEFIELFSESLWAKAIRRGLIFLIPLIIAGSLALVINNLPLAAYQQFMSELFGENWKAAGALIDNLSFGIIGLALTGTVCFTAIEEYNHKYGIRIHPYIVSLAAIISFLLLTNKGIEGLMSKQVGNNAIFLAIVVAIITTELFVRLQLLSSQWFEKGMIDSDPAINKSLSAMIPFLISLTLFTGLKLMLSAMGIEDINDVLSQNLEKLFLNINNPLASLLLYLFLTQLFWFFGIHGSKLLYSVNNNIYLEASKVNALIHAAGEIPENIVTKSFLDAFAIIGGSGATIALILAIFISRQKGTTREIAKYSLLPSVFNINELIVFGLPIVLNPFFIIPFIAVPIILALSAYLASVAGFLPVTTADVIWTTPPLLSGYLATGSVRGTLMQVFNIALGTLIYLPFVYNYNNYRNDVRKRCFETMVAAILKDSCKNTITHTERNDEVGFMAKALVADIRSALTEDQFYLKYQPQVDNCGKVSGFEALLRWKHPLYGEVPPPVIIALAEESNMINEIGHSVIQKALYQLAQWRNAGAKQISLAINVSPSQLKDKTILNTLQAIIDKYELDPSYIELEFTESVEIATTGEVLQVIESLKTMGFKLAMDDFAMGHTSLLYLRHYSLNTIKIDGSLTKDVVNNISCQDIISTLVFLACSTGAKLIAEHVETEEQWQMLIDLGCNHFQGYLFYKPLVAEEAFKIINSHEAPLIAPFCGSVNHT